MDTTDHNMISKATIGQKQAIIELLQSENLPVEDLPASLHHFLVAIEDGTVIGVIGLEQYEQYGLLRSMVVDKSYRNKNIASHLVKELEAYATALGIYYLYLLTETASEYFERKGYERVKREEVPNELHVSSEFSHVCPVSAIVMKNTFTLTPVKESI